MGKLQSIKEYVYLLRHMRRYKSLFFYGGGDGILFESGWMNSMLENSIVDGKGNPIPWYTYSAIFFLDQYDLSTEDVFEWGSGYSTFYYASKVKSIKTVESDMEWFQKIRNRMMKQKHVICLFRNTEKEYVGAISENLKKYSIIIVDGKYRETCGKEAIVHLKENGILILDDSERKEYNGLKKYLVENNFKSLDFWGIAAGISYIKCTSIYYRPSNILNI